MSEPGPIGPTKRGGRTAAVVAIISTKREGAMVNRIRIVVLGFAFGIAVAGGGCDGDSGSGSPVSTSVPGNKRISDLTPAERDQLCADVTQWAMTGPFLTDGCNASAWLAAYLLS